MLGCRLVKWNTEKKFVSAVAVEDFEWQNRWMEAHCDDEMRKWGAMSGWGFSSGTSRMPRYTIRNVPGGFDFVFETPELHKDSVPSEFCKCGFYSFNTLREVGRGAGQEIDNGVLIITQSAGKIVIHERGFRAQYVKPVAVVYPFTYRMETRMIQPDGAWIGDFLHKELHSNPYWIRDIYIRYDYGLTLGHDAAMVAQRLHLPIISPVDAGKMLKEDRGKVQ